MFVPFAPGAPSQKGGPQQPPASHVGRPHPSHPSSAAGLTLRIAEPGADVLPERVRPRGEPTEDSDRETTENTHRKGPRRRGR